MDIDLRIRDEQGHIDHAGTPDDLVTSEFLKEFIPATGRLFFDQQGAPILWTLVDEGTGQELNPDTTFRENGIRSNHELLLSSKARVQPPPDVPSWRCASCGFENLEPSTFCGGCGTRRPGLQIEVMVQDPKGRILNKKVAPEILARHFLHDVLVELGLSTNTSWEIDDKDIPRNLALNETLEQNGVLNGHHLFLRAGQLTAPPPTLWKPIAIVVVVAALAGFAGYKFYERWVSRQGPVTITVSPSQDIRLGEGNSLQFTAQVAGNSNTAVIWSTDPVDTSRLGSIIRNGEYRAPSSISEPRQVTIVATSVAKPDISKSVTVNLVPALGNSASSATTITQPSLLVVLPGSAQLGHSQAQPFSAMRGSNPAAVTWSSSPPGVGGIAQTGVYTAPPSIPVSQSITVTATSTTNSAVFAQATISLVADQPGETAAFTVSPRSVDLGASDERQFGITPSPGAPIQWSHPAIGYISPQGKYTAPSLVQQKQQVKVIATVQGNLAKAAVVTLHPVEVGQPSCVLGTNSQYLCTAHVNYAPQQRAGLSWSIDPQFGSVSQAQGVYTPPSAVSQDTDVTVIAKSLFDPNASNRQVIHVPRTKVAIPATIIRVTISSSHPQVLMNQQKARFSATVTGSSDTSVSWSINGPGAIDWKSGIYLAPGYIRDGETVRVTASSNADPSQSATATLTLRNYIGPDVGAIHWANETDTEQTLTIVGNTVSTGKLMGEPWPPVSVQIDNLPGWDIVEPPSIQNDWKRLVIRPHGGKHKVSIVWRVNHYQPDR